MLTAPKRPRGVRDAYAVNLLLHVSAIDLVSAPFRKLQDHCEILHPGNVDGIVLPLLACWSATIGAENTSDGSSYIVLVRPSRLLMFCVLLLRLQSCAAHQTSLQDQNAVMCPMMLIAMSRVRVCLHVRVWRVLLGGRWTRPCSSRGLQLFCESSLRQQFWWCELGGDRRRSRPFEDGGGR